jgi:aminoglycoside/choline kinase family phosphotransferase
MNSDERLDQLTDWVRQFDGFATARPVPASGDASFRRYFRVQGDASAILMDAPPPQEDCRPFVQIAGFLERMGLNSPRVIECDLDRGFLLLSDLGSVQYLNRIEADNKSAEKLYDDAIDALLTMQSAGVAFQGELPPYDEKLLRFELSLFHDWLCDKHLDIRFSAVDEALWVRCCDALVNNALQQSTVFVHRDYHSRNLMVTATENPGILDFQDAVEGPLTYDLVSLIKDCYVKWPVAEISRRAMYFYEHLPARQKDTMTNDQFRIAFDLMGVQRHLKAAGIFARLLHRDGKTGYLKDVPRTLSYVVDIAPQYPELAFLGNLIAERVLPALDETGA